MSDEIQADTLGATNQQGTEGSLGQAPASADIQGEPGSVTQETGGEPSGEGLPDGLTPETLLKNYKELQGEFTKRNDVAKGVEDKFTRFGGMEQVLQWVEHLSGNPRFNDFVQNERNRNITGDEGELDDETKKALSTVQRIAQHEIQRVMKEKVEPLASSYKEGLIEKHFSSMDEKYGEKWREMQDDMAKLSDELPQTAQDNPSLKDIQALYAAALMQSDKFDDYAADVYKSKLQGMQQKSTELPTTTATKGEPQQARTIREAFEQAKR